MELWNRIKRMFGLAAPKVVDALEMAIKFLAPYAARFILDMAVKKLGATAKRERVLERLRDQAAAAGIRLPDSILSLSLEAEYSRLKAEGLIPGKDPGALLAALPKIRKALATRTGP